MEHIVLIGIDGAGKSTQVEMLTRALNDQYPNTVISLIGKGDGNNCKCIEIMQQASFNMIPQSIKVAGYALDFIYKFIEITRQHKQKKVIVWDRYFYCLKAYFSAMGVEMTEVSQLLSFLPEPSIVFLLDIQPEIAVTRMKIRAKEIKDSELNIQYLAQVRQQYLKMVNLPNLILIDANMDPIDVHNAILENVQSRLNLCDA